MIDFPTAWASSQDEYFDKGLAKCTTTGATTAGRHRFAPHAPYTVNDASFERIRMLSDQLDLPVHCHVHETAQEVQPSRMKQHGKRPIARLDRLGLVNDRLIAVHMTQLTDGRDRTCAPNAACRWCIARNPT